jgi:hypothetical protein
MSEKTGVLLCFAGTAVYLLFCAVFGMKAAEPYLCF